jgi:hypothetical protein
MKKRQSQKKLTLHRETLRRLEATGLRRVHGGVAMAAHEPTDTLCDTVASCTELEEDCCVTTGGI